MKESVCQTVCVSGGTKGANRKKKWEKRKKKKENPAAVFCSSFSILKAGINKLESKSGTSLTEKWRKHLTKRQLSCWCWREAGKERTEFSNKPIRVKTST